MKNIFLTPTDKPSRLYYNTSERLFQLCKVPKTNTPRKNAKNIYITSTEEIKEDEDVYGERFKDGEYILHNSFDEVSIFEKTKYNICKGNFKSHLCRKIILTTDVDLIKDGIQPIPDEFLEWFVKNPSCEEVKIESWETKGEWNLDYKIIIPKDIDILELEQIIPKEEPKQDLEKEMFELEEQLDIPSHLRWHNSKPKQETLEEVANRVLSNADNFTNRDRYHWALGVKWQQERSHSKEEVLNILEEHNEYIYNSVGSFEPNNEEWFKQFKKK